MKSKLIHTGILLELLLSGCATQPRQPVQAPPPEVVAAAPQSPQQKADVWRGILDDSGRCIEQVYNQPDAAPVRVHRPLNILAATRAQLNDRSRASTADIDALNAMHPRIQACRRQFRDAMEVVRPSAVPAFDSQVRTSDKNQQALVERKETWGAYVRQERADAKRNQRAVAGDGQPILSGPSKRP